MSVDLGAPGARMAGLMDADVTCEIRAEAAGDVEGIDLLHRRAFQGDNAADLVRNLREAKGYDLSLSLVAIEREPAPRIIGHILFSPIAIVYGDAPVPALALGPLGVMPDRQGTGVGSALVARGLEACRARAHAVVLVLGDPGYYARFGFKRAANVRIAPPHASWAEAYQVVALQPNALRDVRGTVRYPEPWDHV